MLSERTLVQKMKKLVVEVKEDVKDQESPRQEGLPGRGDKATMGVEKERVRMRETVAGPLVAEGRPVMEVKGMMERGPL